MIRIHFKDEGQDCLWWDVEDGVVVNANLQVDIWKGTKLDVKQDFLKDPFPKVLFRNGISGIWRFEVVKVDRPPGRKIDQLKALLDSQEKDPQNWSPIDSVIKQVSHTPEESRLILNCYSEYLAFIFDGTGEKFLGIANWKE